MNRFTRPLPALKIMIMTSVEKPSEFASGPMMGMDTVAMPDDDGIKNDSTMYSKNDIGAKMTADKPFRAFAALFRIHMSRPVLAMSTVMERASAMMSTTDIMSAAPLMNAFTKRLSDTPPMTPMMSAMSRNHVEASSKYQLPSGTPVRKLDQAG